MVAKPSRNVIVRCHVALVGTTRYRVSRVLALLCGEKGRTRGLSFHIPAVSDAVENSVCEKSFIVTKPLRNAISSALATGIDDFGDGTVEKNNTCDCSQGAIVCHVNFLPCVAAFEKYTNSSGESVRYLARMEYHPMDSGPSSVAPFFDDAESVDVLDVDEGVENRPRHLGVVAVAVGCGIDSVEDVGMIERFVDLLSPSANKDCASSDQIPWLRKLSVECIRPNPKYQTMGEENKVYRALDDQEKEKLFYFGSHIGPGKMAQFVADLVAKELTMSLFSKGIIKERPSMKAKSSPTIQLEGKQKFSAKETGKKHESPARALIAAQDECNIVDVDRTQDQPNKGSIQFTKRLVVNGVDVVHADSVTTRFACRRCRTVLFGEDDLEDPPHAIAIHNFRERKMKESKSGRIASSHPGSLNASCKSAFLSTGVDWMGDMCDVEGKFACPKCNTKVGHWNWSGAQCSCGTWVTPAIQVPWSRVDIMAPLKIASSSRTHQPYHGREHVPVALATD